MSEATAGFQPVARVGEIPEGGVKVARVGEILVAIFHVEGRYYALEDVCTHDGGPLAEGILEDHGIECPRHGARFDVRTGAVLSLPAVTPVPTFEVRVVEDSILVGIPGSEGQRPASTEQRSSDGSREPVPPLPGVGRPEAHATAGAPSASNAPSQQEMAIRSALETVMDPEIGLSVIDLGLIREVTVGPAKTSIQMLLTTPFCPYAPQMIEDVKQAAQSVVPQDCDVEILPDPWSPDMMPDPGLLGYSF